VKGNQEEGKMKKGFWLWGHEIGAGMSALEKEGKRDVTTIRNRYRTLVLFSHKHQSKENAPSPPGEQHTSSNERTPRKIN
jgi:hypothetical protein